MNPGSKLNACDGYQMIPLISRGLMIYYLSTLIAISASIDFVMADVDR